MTFSVPLESPLSSIALIGYGFYCQSHGFPIHPPVIGRVPSETTGVAWVTHSTNGLEMSITKDYYGQN